MAHKLFAHKLSVPPFVPGIVPGTNWVCPWNKPGEIGLPLCKIRRKPGFVPRPTGQKSLCLCAFFLPECDTPTHTRASSPRPTVWCLEARVSEHGTYTSPTRTLEKISRNQQLGNENSAQSFSDRSFWKSLRVVDVRAFGSWISAPKCLFSRILSALTEVLGRDIRANDPPDVRGISGPKTSSCG